LTVWRDTFPLDVSPARSERLLKSVRSPPTRTLVVTSPAGSRTTLPVSNTSICVSFDTE